MACSIGGLQQLWLPAIIVLLAISATSTHGLANCPPGCVCDDTTLDVNCKEGQLDVLPITLNPSIQRLIIKNNKIKTIDSALQFYSELSFLDLSYNHLFNIPPGTFNYQRKLRQLHLNHNKINSISNSTFNGLASLTVLNLHGNFLDELGGSCFSTLPKLEELNVGQNRIVRIDARAFAGLTALRVLYLDDNSLTTVPSAAFAHVPQLAELYLGFNSFADMATSATASDSPFANLRSLNQLQLNGASLFNISARTFAGLESVRILDLSDNRLRRIPTAELAALQRLEELSLGQNDFTVVPAGAFAGMPSLRKLDISGSLKLTQVQAGAFEGNANVEHITIAANKALTEVQDGAFGGLPHLRHLVLRDNALTTLAEGWLAWGELQTLDVAENPLACDCRLVWLRNLLVAKNVSTGSAASESAVLCAGPEPLRGVHLRDISVSALGCTDGQSQRQAIIGLCLVGVAAFITALLLISYKCRKRIREMLKGRWGNSALGRKEREYQKTFSDEEYMAQRSKQQQQQLQQQQQPVSLGVHPMGNGAVSPTAPSAQTTMATSSFHPGGMRPIPVTEL